MLFFVALIIAGIIVCSVYYINDIEEEKKQESTKKVPISDFNFDDKCKCRHCEHNKKEEDE